MQEKEEIAMELSAKGIIGKLESNAGLIGGAIGIGTWGYDQLLEGISLAASGKVHMPDLERTIKAFFEDKNKGVIMTAAGLYIAGEILGKESLKKAAQGLVGGNAIQHVLWWSTHSTPEEFNAMAASHGGRGGNLNSIGNRGYGY